MSIAPPVAAPGGLPDRDETSVLSRWFTSQSVACVIVSAETLDIIEANAAASRLLSAPGDLSRNGDRLVLGGVAASDRFRLFLAGLNAVPGVYVVGSSDDRTLLRVERIEKSNLIAVHIVTPDHGDGLWADTRAIFGLTPAEDRLIKRLIGGANIEEISEDLNISIETARTHVRRSYLKIGVNNREQLFAALAPFRLSA